MAITIDSAFVEMYKDQVIHLAQQGETRLRPHVTEVANHGEAYNFDVLAPTAPVQKTTRRQVTPYIDDTWTRRVAVPQTWNHNMTFENEDRVQMIIDPQQAYASNQAMAMKRAYDDLIIAAATGDALDGAGALQSFPAGQVVGDGTGAISFDLVTQVQEAFLGNDITADIPKVMIVGPVQVRQMMAEAKATSTDYISRPLLDQLTQYGVCANFMGFTWILSNRLLVPAGGQLSCLAFTRQALGLAVNMDVMMRITEDPAHSYMWQVFAQWTAGCVRVEDEHIVHLHVLNS